MAEVIPEVNVTIEDVTEKPTKKKNWFQKHWKKLAIAGGTCVLLTFVSRMLDRLGGGDSTASDQSPLGSVGNSTDGISGNGSVIDGI